ncbi:MAG: SMP-30/gluconolactonase/LRE family protein [Wenzhouxiangella sp.]
MTNQFPGPALRSSHLFLLISLGLLLVLPALLTPNGVRAQPVAADAPQSIQLSYWFDRAARAFNEDRLDDWVTATEQLHQLRPHNQDLMRHLVVGYARQNRLSEAFSMMLTMQQQGLAEDWTVYEELEPLRPHRLYSHLTDLMRDAGQPFGLFDVYAELPQDLAMPEAVAIDRAANRLFVGSLRDGRIHVRGPDGEWQLFVSPDSVEGLNSVFGLDVDAERGHLWVATGHAPQFVAFDAEAAPQTALLKLDLKTGERLAKHTIGESALAHLLGSVIVASDGTVFAADTRHPLLFRLQPEAESLELFFGSQNLTSLRGLALSGDNRLLYVADYELGIVIVAADGTQQAWQLAAPETLNLGGIDGIYWWNQHLVVIQNGISPQRVLRLQLGPDGLGVTAVAPVLAALEEFDTPTFGTMDGSRLLMLSGSHWQHVDGRGRALADALPPISLLETDVASTEIMAVGEEALRQMRGR